MSMQYTPPELSEDCLYLNVFTPAEAKQGDKLPVGVTNFVYMKGLGELHYCPGLRKLHIQYSILYL